MNVVEDARIEKLIKRKYNGLRQSFIRGYRELITKDFFGTAKKDINEMLSKFNSEAIIFIIASLATKPAIETLIKKAPTIFLEYDFM